MSDYQLIQSKSAVFYDNYDRKADLQHQTHYCPGCGHGITHKLVAEAIADMGVQERTIFVSPVGCSVFAYYYFDVGNVQAAHGRTPAVATALKRSRPGSLVVGYQGDGDLAAIGTAEIIHAANRGEKITIFFVNNAIYGMTGGQMAPTTLVGQTSTTTPWGRRPGNEGYPIHVSELLATLEAPAYIERVSLHDSKNIMKARKAIRKALELQRDGAGFSFVEVLSPCPTIWKMNPTDAQKWIAEKMLPVFPLGVYRDRKPAAPADDGPRIRTVADLFGIDGSGEGVEGGRGAAPVTSKPLTIKVAGFGGQGVLLLGQMLAEIGMRQGMEVSWLPSYGPEMRSGSAHCHICMSNERIGSPLISSPDVLVAMNELSLRKFGPQVKPGGLILYNRDALPEGFEHPKASIICVPASEIADRLGTAKAANVVLLGALQAETGAFELDVALKVLEKTVKNPAMLALNKKAIEAGGSFVSTLAGAAA